MKKEDMKKKLEDLYKKKIYLQDFEAKLRYKKLEWRKLGKEIRQDGQKYSKLMKEFLEQI